MRQIGLSLVPRLLLSLAEPGYEAGYAYQQSTIMHTDTLIDSFA